MKIDALVLAGARNDGQLKEVSDSKLEALISINDQPMVNYVITALKATSMIGEIVVVGDLSLQSYLPSDVTLVECGETLPENIKLGIDYLDARSPVLVVTSDIPMLTAQAVEDFLVQCQQRQAELYYPIVRKETNDQVFPGVVRTYLRLKDGIFTGGNMILMAPYVITDYQAEIQKIVELRKKPLQLVRMLGIVFIIRLLSHRLTIIDIEQRVQKMFSLNAVTVISSYPEIGTDVDKPSDLELAQKVLAMK